MIVTDGPVGLPPKNKKPATEPQPFNIHESKKKQPEIVSILSFFLPSLKVFVIPLGKNVFFYGVPPML